MGWVHTYNITTQFAAFPCAQPDPIIIALTAVPAIAPALFEFAGVSCRDILKFKLGRGAPCGRALKGLVGKAIPPKFANLAQGLLHFEHGFSQAGNAFLIADLASDTVARWTTLAYQLEGCPDALEGATWGLKFEAPQSMLAGVPEYIGGTVINYKGNPGIGWPTGAVVPRDWYFSAEINVKAIGEIDRVPAGLTIWVRRESPDHYDFAGLKYDGGYPFLAPNAHYYLPEQHNATRRSVAYNFMAMSDRNALTTELTATCQATPFPQANWALSPLTCIKALTGTRVEHPGVKNPRTDMPTATERLLGHLVPPPTRGPPKGKPRSKK